MAQRNLESTASRGGCSRGRPVRHQVECREPRGVTNSLPFLHNPRPWRPGSVYWPPARRVGVANGRVPRLPVVRIDRWFVRFIGGKVAARLFGSTPGYSNPNLTIKDVRDHLAEILDAENLVIATIHAARLRPETMR